MLLWALACGIGLAFVAALILAEIHFEHQQGLIDLQWSLASRVAAKTVLFVALSAAIHATIDPDHHRYTHELHQSQVLRAVYGFTVTGALLFAFPNLRIFVGASMIGLAVSVAEVLQWTGVLPGTFRAVDWASGLIGVAAAAIPMWIGAQRARRNVAWEQEQERKALKKAGLKTDGQTR